MNRHEARALLEQVRYFRAYLSSQNVRCRAAISGQQPDSRVDRLRKLLSGHEHALTDALENAGIGPIQPGAPYAKSQSTLACVIYYAMFAERLTYEDLARITLLLEGYVQHACAAPHAWDMLADTSPP